MVAEPKPFITEPIIFTAARLESIANRFVFEPMGLTAASGKILKVLGQRGALTPSEIGHKTGGTKSNISQRLSFLEKKGLIIRQVAANQADRRQVKIMITPAGRTKMQKIHQRIAHPAHCLEQHFTTVEVRQFFQFFAKLNNILDESESCLAQHFN